jgi:DNA-binding MarR family transcriptional regulator
MSGEDEEEASGRAIVWPLERLARVMRAREHEEGLNPAQWEALRYLSRANRFSNSPAALTRYLGATKGTVSQTVMALARKGFIAKSLRDGGRKSLSLVLTDKGRDALARDPWAALAQAADGLGGKTRRRLQRGVVELLDQELARTGLRSFGACSSCRFFRERGRSDDPKGPHLCMLFEDPLSEDDTARICQEHQQQG